MKKVFSFNLYQEYLSGEIEHWIAEWIDKGISVKEIVVEIIEDKD